MEIPNLIAGTLCLAALTAIARADDAAWQPVKRSHPEASTVRPRTVYMLPHSHTDIGYTTHQVDIYEKQINNLLQGLAEAKRTADYPEGARFVWNVEGAWAADLMLKRLPKTLQDEFFNAVKRGQISINGMYLNNLTGLSRPEELIRLFRYSTQLAERNGVAIDSAMISDVPGYTWGTVPAMNQAGIRYFSVAPSYFDRIGTSCSNGKTSFSGGSARMANRRCWSGFPSWVNRFMNGIPGVISFSAVFAPVEPHADVAGQIPFATY
jgi:hypothetical protein